MHTLANRILSGAQKFAYHLAMVTADPTKSFVERHSIGLDAAMAQSLRVPGLDEKMIKPTPLMAHIAALDAPKVR